MPCHTRQWDTVLSCKSVSKARARVTAGPGAAAAATSALPASVSAVSDKINANPLNPRLMMMFFVHFCWDVDVARLTGSRNCRTQTESQDGGVCAPVGDPHGC